MGIPRYAPTGSAPPGPAANRLRSAHPPCPPRPTPFGCRDDRFRGGVFVGMTAAGEEPACRAGHATRYPDCRPAVRGAAPPRSGRGGNRQPWQAAGCSWVASAPGAGTMKGAAFSTRPPATRRAGGRPCGAPGGRVHPSPGGGDLRDALLGRLRPLLAPPERLIVADSVGMTPFLSGWWRDSSGSCPVPHPPRARSHLDYVEFLAASGACGRREGGGKGAGMAGSVDKWRHVDGIEIGASERCG